ncbi:copper resistance CopC/CopD family protein [Streptomyces sp. NPDC057403]|uniref:copper resistance CopC/CopD family protein n=1 Tax=Streptomyces sp. NPDC057403 TaxID=3346119 RepID=UPI0036835B65
MLERQAGDGKRVIGSVLAVVAVLGWLLFAGAPPAAAHAVLTGSAPRDGSVVKAAPREVTATFDESVALVEDSMRVVDPDGRPVTAGDPHHAGGKGNTARVALTSSLGQGTYTVSWRVVSADSHAVSGAFTFSIGKPSATRAAATATPAVDAHVNTLYGIGRYVGYGALALLIGFAVFILACRPPASSERIARRAMILAWWALTMSTVALLLLRGPYDNGDGLTGVFDPGSLGHTTESRPGIALLARLFLLLAVAVLARRRTPRHEYTRGAVAVGSVFCVGLAATWAAAEHASVGTQVPVAMASAVLHLLAMAVWLGGLAALLLTLYRARADDPLPPAAVARFSRIALSAVAVLAVTGVYQSWRALGSWEAFSTPYGRVLALKIWAVLLTLLAASYSRRWTARLVRIPAVAPVLIAVGNTGSAPSDDIAEPTGEPTPPGAGAQAFRRGLRRSVLAETVVGAVVLALTTVLTGTETGRAVEETAATASRVPGQPDISLTLIPYDTGKNTLSGRGKVQVTLSPGRTGRNVVEALIYGADGSPVSVPELRLSFTDESRRIGPLDSELVDEHGYWGSDTLSLPVAGTWTMKATVRVSDIDQVTVEKTVAIGR